jgi:hypothetical protein
MIRRHVHGSCDTTTAALVFGAPIGLTPSGMLLGGKACRHIGQGTTTAFPGCDSTHRVKQPRQKECWQSVANSVPSCKQIGHSRLVAPSAASSSRARDEDEASGDAIGVTRAEDGSSSIDRTD